MALTNKSIATFFFVATADGRNKHMDPESLEILLMMTVNRNLWSLKVIHEITNNADNNF